MDLYLTTAFAFTTCDGKIADEEISLIKEMNDKGVFHVDDLNTELDALIVELNDKGKDFMKSYLDMVEKADISEGEALKLLKVAVKTIYADNIVEYSEVKFFRALRVHLHNISDAAILENIPEIEDFWLEADAKSDAGSIERDYFDSIVLKKFELKKTE